MSLMSVFLYFISYFYGFNNCILIILVYIFDVPSNKAFLTLDMDDRFAINLSIVL